MLVAQKNYIDDVENLIASLKNVDIATEKLEDLDDLLKKSEVLIPVVGEFSAGKSSLLNSFIGEDILPTSIKPETAIATELRFDTNERIEAIDENGNIIRTFSKDEFETINANASEYSYLKLYLNNENIRSVSPLVLVDMPGFESPLDSHNNAIRKYLNRGAYFIVLVSATDGTLKTTSIRHLNDILEYERDFSVVLSKANLVSQNNLSAISQKVCDDIDMNFALSKTPVAVERDGTVAIKKIIENLDPDKLYSSLVIPSIRDVIYQIESTVNVKSAAFNKDTKENDLIIEKLKKSLEKIKREEENLKQNARNNYVQESVSSIVNKVGSDLSASCDNLVEIALKNGNEAFSAEISDIVHSSLVSSVKANVQNISDRISSQYNLQLKELGESMNDYSSGDFLKTLGAGANAFVETLTGIADLKKGDKTKIGKTIYTTVTSILAITTSVINPVLELVIVFLPTILDFLTKGAKEREQQFQLQQQKDNIRSQILTKIIPDVKRKLSSELPSILEEQVDVMIEEISNRYSVLIEEKQSEIAQAENERQQKAEEIAQKIANLENAKSAIKTLNQKIFA